MFYGASKNKNGKEISDYDKYKPWKAEEFSGKIKYTLENGKEYEVFRDFSKKNPKIYNENLEDISNNFNIDKTKGNQFFVEQTGIDEGLFLNTMAVCQNEVTLDNSKQNALVQKITNVVSSGDDNTSYKRTMDKLNKKLLDEVGTARTTERPINIIEKEIKELETEKNELELYRTQANNMDIEKLQTKNKLQELETELKILKEIKEYKQSEMLEEQKIEINAEKLNEYNSKLNELQKNKKQETKAKKKILNPVISLVIAIILTGSSVIFKSAILSTSLGVIFGILFIVNFYMYSKYKKYTLEQKEENIKYNKELEVIRENIKQYSDEIKLNRENIEQKQNEKKQYLKSKYGNMEKLDDYIIEDFEQIAKNIDEKQNEYNEIMLHDNTINIQKSNILARLENLAKQEERLQYLYEQQDELKKLANLINLAQLGLEEAYTIMKNTVTPKFTDELTNIIKDITNGKYNKVKFSDNEGLTIELENGEYINCNKLSIGTIDQMYLALRLSILNEISKEQMPIILDESFAYYDKNRLENILNYIAKQYADRQIIILTCNSREIEALNNLQQKYNLVNL